MHDLLERVLEIDQRNIILIKQEIDCKKSVNSLASFIKASCNIDLLLENEYAVVVSKTHKIARIIGFAKGLAVDLQFKRIKGSFKITDSLPQDLIDTLVNEVSRYFIFIWKPMDGRQVASQIASEILQSRGINAFDDDIGLIIRTKTKRELRIIRIHDNLVENLNFRGLTESFTAKCELKGRLPGFIFLSESQVCTLLELKGLTIKKPLL